MDDYGISLGVPNASHVEGVTDKRHPNQEKGNRKKKKEEKKKTSLMPKPDEVIISSQALPVENGAAVKPEHEKDARPKLKGENVDIKA